MAVTSLFRESKKGRVSYSLPKTKVTKKDYLGTFKRKELPLPELSERQIAGHFQNLAEMHILS